MSQKPQKVSEAGRSPREIGEAIAQLSDSELLRLRKFARFRVRGIGLAAEGMSAEDVLQEAVTLDHVEKALFGCGEYSSSLKNIVLG